MWFKDRVGSELSNYVQQTTIYCVLILLFTWSFLTDRCSFLYNTRFVKFYIVTHKNYPKCLSENVA